MNRIGTPETIGELNKKLILNHLRGEGNMSRADLSRKLGMSFPAVSSNVKALLDAGYIRETGEGNNSLGRKSTMLSFNADRGYIVGVDVGRFRLRVMVANLLGEVIASAHDKSRPHGMVENICRLVREAVQKSGKKPEQMLCICAGIPGIINQGESYLAPFVDSFSEQELQDSLMRCYPQADLLLENCVNLGALGEQWKGAGASYGNIAYVSYGIGLGTAFIIDGKLYKGANGAAGEIGFMLTDPLNMRSGFDEIGALEDTLSSQKINKCLQNGDFKEELVMLIKKYEEGEMYAKLVLDEIALHLGMALVNICAVMNPEAIIMSGGIGANLGGLFRGRWEEMLGNHVPFAPKLIFSQMDNHETMMGAIVTGINHVHNK